MKHMWVDESTYRDAVSNGLIIETKGESPILLTLATPDTVNKEENDNA